jgi:L-alanine-DL-glutamate epimerase-like enolase superfamily enzyme
MRGTEKEQQNAIKIQSVEAIPLAASFKTTFRFGTTNRTTSPNIVVIICTDEGPVGYGETCPVPAFTSETQKSIVELVEQRVAPVLVGKDPERRVPLLHELGRVLKSAPFTVTAVDTALLDLLGRALQVPMHTLLGGAFRDRTEVHGPSDGTKTLAGWWRPRCGKARPIGGSSCTRVEGEIGLTTLEQPLPTAQVRCGHR